MRTLPETATRPQLYSLNPAKILETALWTVSLICLALFVWMKADAWRYQREASQSWDRAAAAKAAGETVAKGRGAELSELDPVSRSGVAKGAVASGEPIGRITIPRLDLAVVIAEGTSNDVLQKAVGHLAGTARPGEEGNVVLAGHRDTFFRPLESIRLGDRIELDGGSGPRAYIVEWTRVVPPDQIEVAAPTAEPALTLVTCYPFRYIGSAPERFIVRARAVEGARGMETGRPRATGAGD